MGRGSNEILGGDTSFTILAEKADELFERIRRNLKSKKWADPDDYGALEIVHDILIYLAMDNDSLSAHFPEPTEIRHWTKIYFDFYDQYWKTDARAGEDGIDVEERRQKLLKPFERLLKRSKEYHGLP